MIIDYNVKNILTLTQNVSFLRIKTTYSFFVNIEFAVKNFDNK